MLARSCRAIGLGLVLALAFGACSSGTDADGDAGGPRLDAGRTADGGVPAPDAPPPDAPTPPSGIAYDEDGPIAFEMHVDHVDGGGVSFDVTVYMPTSPGPHPAVAFSCGTNQSAAGYAPYGERLASHGIAMFLMDDPGVFTNTSDIVPNVEHLVETWLPATYAGTIDTTRIGLAGHSRGGGVSLLAAEHMRGDVVAWFGLDPVDNEFLMAPREYARTSLADIGIPTGFLGAEVESTCAPAADSYRTLHPLAPPPKVLVVGLGAGHEQVEVESACNLCGVCTPSGTADGAVVLAYSVRYFTAFFARELLGDDSVGAAFEGAGGPADVAAGLVTIM